MEETCSLSWQGQCFCLLLVINVFLLLRRGKTSQSLGTRIVQDERSNPPVMLWIMTSDLITVPRTQLLLSTEFWWDVYAQGWEVKSVVSKNQISPPCYCLSLAPPSSSATAQINSFDDMTWKCEGFRRICSLWLHIKTSLHQGKCSLTPATQLRVVNIYMAFWTGMVINSFMIFQK